MRVTVENGRAIKVVGDPEHPPTQGALCTKVSRYAERVHHPRRLDNADAARSAPKAKAVSSRSAGTKR